jgi:ATP-binding cassette subfamily B protein
MAEEYDEINRAYRDASKRSVFYEALLDAAIEMVGTVCIASTLVWAGIETRMASIGVEGVTFEKVVVFTQYIRQFFEPVSMLSQRYTVLQGALAGAERIFELLDETDVEGESVEPPSEPPVPIAGAPAVVFDQVSFSYKRGTSALRDVSFRIEAGQFVGIVGATGAGKTTLVQLLLQLYPQDEGTISVFGHDASAMTPESLRRLFAVVPQDVFLFSGSILDNVAVGAKAPDRERARSALQRAHAWDLVEAREGGLDAPVDERGSNFSAGERQLLAFARALYVDAPVFLLDEATASVDSDTELRLKRAFEEVRQGRTALVIAHRLATIRAADQILVFHRGRLEERGSHRELMDAQGIYARLSSLQSSHDRGMGANGSRDDASRSFVA